MVAVGRDACVCSKQGRTHVIGDRRDGCACSRGCMCLWSGLMHVAALRRDSVLCPICVVGACLTAPHASPFFYVHARGHPVGVGSSFRYRWGRTNGPWHGMREGTEGQHMPCRVALMSWSCNCCPSAETLVQW